MHARYQSSRRRLVEHFQEHESTGRLGKPRGNQMSVPQWTRNVGIWTRLAFSISTSKAANIIGTPANVSC